jgi:hypothetical protein
MIEFPDVSHWQGQLPNITLAKAWMAKCTEGTTFLDPTYAWYRDQAARVGAPFLGYHYLLTGNSAGQAAWAKKNGAGPLMLDVEMSGNTFPTMDETRRFIDAHGHVTLAYIPAWFWSLHWGKPDLTWLTDQGIGLISSNYSTSPDVGWVPYGGVTPVVWQYTSTYPWAGQSVDMNRFHGTVEQLRNLFNGTPPPPQPTEEDPMTKTAILIEPTQTCHLWWLADDGPWYMTLDRADVLAGLHAILAPVDVTVTTEDVATGRWGRKWTPAAVAGTTPGTLPPFQIQLTGRAEPTH